MGCILFFIFIVVKYYKNLVIIYNNAEPIIRELQDIAWKRIIGGYQNMSRKQLVEALLSKPLKLKKLLSVPRPKNLYLPQ